MTDLEKIKIIKDFVKYCYYQLGIKSSPEIIIVSDKNWVKEKKSFGCYEPEAKTVHAYLGNRNLADFLRTLAHELIHHKQNEDGLIKMGSGETGSDIENEANSKAGVILRDYGKTHDMIYESKK